MIYVYDNNSRDRTLQVAHAAGAEVRIERRQGKGNVVRRMFADIEADAYVLVDGDATYDAISACAMVRCLYVARLFGRPFSDLLSGYRVFSRRFVKSFPALSVGFETETELTVDALELCVPVMEIETPYGARMEGSTSKLSTYRDGLRILRLILQMYKHERPMSYFSILAGVLALLSVMLGTPLILEWLDTGLVPRFPTAILATGVMIMAFLLLTVGLVLETVTRGRQELKRLVDLQVPRFGLHR